MSEHNVSLDIQDNGWAILRLDRPKALQALNLAMVTELHQLLADMQANDAVKAVWIESTTDKAFCAGGDVRSVRQSVIEGHPEAGDAFFQQEYALDLLLHTYAKPLVVWGGGYVMGGGMGILMACPFRIVTPKSRLAMPEVQIGLFPDVGGSRFLAERGRVGLFLGMTGSILPATGSYMIRWATHVTTDSKADVFERLQRIDWSSRTSRFALIDDALNAVHQPLSETVLQDALDSINSLCRGDDFTSDYTNLCNLVEAQSPWLRTAGENISNGAPSTAALTWLLWNWAKNKSWQDVFALEYELACWKIRHPDFSEGVRARLVDKDLSPQWLHPDAKVLAHILPELPASNDSDWKALLTKHGILAI